MANIPKPMNPFADKDWNEAVKRAYENLDALKVETHLEFAEHKNKAVIKYRYNGAWTDFYAILIHNGYEVTARLLNKEEIEFTWGDM